MNRCFPLRRRYEVILAGQRLFFHGSPRQDLIILAQGSWITPDPHTAFIMGMNYNGRTWSDEDLLEPYKFGEPFPRFRVWPKGHVTIYHFLLYDTDIEDLDNPWEFRTKQEIDLRN